MTLNANNSAAGADPQPQQVGSMPPRRTPARSRLTIRVKVFFAFVLLATVGGSGGLLSLFKLHDLARTYQHEQFQVAVHEAIHEDGTALLTLLNLVTRYQALSGPARQESALRRLIESRMLQLEASDRMCRSCHTHLSAEMQFTAHLSNLKHGTAAILKPSASGNPQLDGAASLGAVEKAIMALEDSRSRMETRLHQMLEHRRERGKTILVPSLWQQLALVLVGLAVAMPLAWLMSRAVSRPILPLISAARRIGSGDVSPPIEVPRDPDLAAVVVALNEMATLVAQQAREHARRQLLDRTISSQEDERKRVARELHDVLGQSLSALLMEIRSRNACQKGGSSGMEGNELEARVSTLLDEVRRMAWDLRPSLLDDLGLHSALGRYTEDLAKRHGMPVDFQAAGFDPGQGRLPGNIETVLYRVAQEALTNVTRHARASHVSVVLVKRDQEAALLVEDDGVGFDVETLRRSRASLGILGMEERVSLAGGNLTIVSTPRTGTSVRAQVPLNGPST